MNDGSQGDNAATERNVLPTGWAWATLRDIASLKGGITKGQKRGPNVAVREVPYLRVANVQRGFLDLAEVKTIEATQQDLDDLRLQPGDVLFNEGGDRDKLGRGWVWRGEIVDCIHQNHVFRARLASPDLDPKFVSWYGNSAGQSYFWDEGRQTTNLASINLSKLGSLPVPLSPAAEQRRIVAEIEKQFSRLDAGVAALRRVQANLKRYRASVLQAACEGRLVPTEAELARAEGREYEPASELLDRVLHYRRLRWEADHGAKLKQRGSLPANARWKDRYVLPSAPDVNGIPAPPPGWVAASLEQLTSATRVICYGILMPKENLPDGVPYVRVKDMKGDRIDVAGLHRTSNEIAAEYARASLKPGDILLAIRGTYGRVCEVPDTLDGANITQDTARLAVSPGIDPRFAAIALRGPLLQGYFKRVARGVAVKGVNIADVRLAPVLLPPFAEQKRIVAEVDRRLSVLDENEQAIAVDLKRAERLRQSILKRAFEGKLVQQDPADEPASVLLERIRAEHAAGNGKSARNGRGRKPTAPQPVLEI